MLFLLLGMTTMAQQSLEIEATLNATKHTIAIDQKIVFENTSNDTLSEIYLYDWANSFSSKTSPLAKRFAEHYENAFHFESNADRGMTIIKQVFSESNTLIPWERGSEVDILKVIPENPILPGESYTFNLKYESKISNSKFTRYGVTKD